MARPNGLRISRRPYEDHIDRSGKRSSKSPAFKNATAGVVGYMRVFGGSFSSMPAVQGIDSTLSV